MPREGRDVDVGPERDASRLDDPARVESPALDRSPRPGDAEDPDAPRRASTDAGERTGASGRSSDAGSLASESSSASPTASAAIVELDGLVDRPAEARAKRPFEPDPDARDGTNAHPPSASENERDPACDSTPFVSPRRSFGAPRVSRQKSWGSAKIARLDEEARADSLRETKRREAQRSLPLFSKLRYVLLCGEPLQAERMLSARLHRMSAAAATKTRKPRRDAKKNANVPARSVSSRGSFSNSFSSLFFSFAEAPRGNRPSSMTVRRRTREDAPMYDTRAFEDERFEKHWWMIHPFSRFRRRWDVTVVVATAYVALLAPFVIGFDVDAPRGSALFFFDRCADGAFFLDVLLNYFTGYVETNRGRVVLEPRAVAWTYTKTWAPLDALASVPFDLVFPDEETNRETEYAYGSAESFDFASFPPPPPLGASLTGTSSRADAAYRGAKVVRVIKLVRLLKLFRVLRVTRALARLERGMSIRYGAWQIVKFACVVLTLAHWQACGWFLTHAVQKSASYDSEEVVATWVDVLAEAQGTAPETLDDASRFAKYAACVYWATTTMTTIGYGDIVPVTSVERVVVIVAQLIGSCVFLYGLTQVTALVADNDSGDVEFQRVLDDANKYFEKRSVPTSLRQKVREHLHHRRFFFASSSVGGGGGFETSSEEDSGVADIVGDTSYGQRVASSSCVEIARRVPRTRGGVGSRLDAFCADDDGERRVLSRLSLEVRREVRLWSMRDVLNQQPFFRDDPNETFVKMCTDSLRRRFFGPNERVVGAGDVARELFFLSRGDAEVRTRRGRRVRALPEGAMFGEIALVLSMASGDERSFLSRGGSRGVVRKEICKTIRRTADVRTSAFVETLVLSDAAYLRAAAAAPETAAEVERLARERFRSVNAARWRSATLAVIAANAILRNAGFPSVARGRAESGAYDAL